MKIKRVIGVLFFLCFSTQIFTSVEAQTYMETFGQNRVQKRKFDWRFFDSEHFRVYHYDAAGRQLARYVAEQAEKDIKVVEKKMGGKFPDRFKIILYNNFDEFRQTNVGKKFDSQLQNVPAGTVDLVGDRLVVYFTGVHSDLRRQLRSGMSKVVMQRMLFGENFRQMVKNAVLLNLPAWTTEGFLAYLVDGWDAQSETDWKNLLQANPKSNFYTLADMKPELSGKAFWKFVSENYGEAAVKTLLANMQSRSSLPKGVQMTLGISMKVAFDSILHFYNSVYSMDAKQQDSPDSISSPLIAIPVPSGGKDIREIRVAPKGNDIAYVMWKEGQYQVILQHTQNEQEKVVLVSGGIKDRNEPDDPDYPLLAWSNNGYKLAILYKQNKRTRLRIYSSLNAKIENYVVPNNRFDRVLGMSFMEDDSKMVFSAIRKSQTDLYEFSIRRLRLTPITKDAWDDIQPWFVSGGSRRGILFLSNRPKPNLDVPLEVNELPAGKMNVFFYDTKTKRNELLQVSHNMEGNITQPIQYGSENFAFLNDANGIRNQYVVLFGRNKKNEDSAYAVPVTNYSESILYHQYNPASNRVAEVVQVGKQYQIFFKKLELPKSDSVRENLLPTTLSVKQIEIALPQKQDSKDTKPITVRKYTKSEPAVYQSEFAPEQFDTSSHDMDTIVAEAPEINSEPYPENAQDSFRVDSTYVKLKAQPYRLSFKPDFFTVRVDNSILFNKYQSTQSVQGLPVQNLAGLITLSLEDVMENHRITGGFRLPLGLSGSTYFLQYENFERRWDWKIMLLRNTERYSVNVGYVDTSTGQTGMLPNAYPVRSVTNMIQGSASYPLDRIRSLRLHLAFRQDVANYRAVDTISLKYLPRESYYWTISRAEYVFDNTVNPVMNILKGSRYKLYAEYFYKLSSPNGGFFNIGLDGRKYMPVYRNIVFATRLSYAHSEGKQCVNYVMGGVDNWMMPKQNDMPPPTSQNYAFQSLTTNLRGYPQAARQGNSFALINAELRVPILSTLLRRPIQSNFLKNLQAIAFLDVGSAWNGWAPNSSDEAYTLFTPKPLPVLVTLPSPDRGIAMGYGAGLRTMLFGYFMRFDAAWNIEQKTAKPMFLFSIGSDF